MCCGLHRYIFGCIFSHVGRCFLDCRVSNVQLRNTQHRCTQSSLNPKHFSVPQQEFLLGHRTTWSTWFYFQIRATTSVGGCHQPWVATNTETCSVFRCTKLTRPDIVSRISAIFVTREFSFERNLSGKQGKSLVSKLSYSANIFNLKVYCRKKTLVGSLPYNKTIFEADRWS